jgi:hypothetical protein
MGVVADQLMLSYGMSVLGDSKRLKMVQMLAPTLTK